MIMIITGELRAHFQTTVVYMLPFPHQATMYLQHSPSKNRNHNHTQHTQSSLADLRHHESSRSTRTPTRARASCATAACPRTTRGRTSASSWCTCRGRGVVAVAEDIARRNTVIHEAALQIRHGLLDRQAVVSAVVVPGLNGGRLATVFHDGGCVGGESRGGAANSAGDICGRELSRC